MREGAVTLVEYKVQSDKIAEQEAAVQEWVGAIRALDDPNVSYTVLKAEDGLSLRHVIWGANGEAVGRLQTLPLFKSFAEGTGERSEDGVTVTRMSVLASSTD